MEKVSEERVRAVERRAELEGAWDVVSVAREVLELWEEAARARAKLDLVARELAEENEVTRRLRAELAVAATDVDGVWRWQGDGEDHLESLSCPVVMSADTLRSMLAEHARVRGILDQLAVSPPAVYELVQALIGLLDEHDIPLGDLWAKVDAAGLRRPLVFANVQPGDQTAGNPATEEGRVAIMRQICPSLTREQARIAADEARRRGLRVTVGDTRALIEELFGEKPHQG